ncbi:MAG: TetR/AcrR family transcriptional regulator [Chloroflexi bacterium]|nr:TetR/AcrR family transcriptional regulator [Chloroflexota bacterium]
MPKVPEAHLEARRRSILEAASRVFSREGIQDATMAAVAREAGISPGAIYRYFASKDELAHVCFLGGSAEVAARWAPVAEGTVDPMADLEALAADSFGRIVDPAERTYTILALEHMLDLARSNDAAGLLAAKDSEAAVTIVLRNLLARARAEGDLPSSIDPKHLAHALMAFYWGSRLTLLVDPDADVQGALQQVINLMRIAAGKPVR